MASNEKYHKSEKTMRLIQITDLHLGLPGEDTFGVDVRDNFTKVLAAARALQPDYLLLTGDLCFRQGEVAIYEWVRDHLQAIAIPFAVIPGNHDDPVLLAQTFGLAEDLHQEELYFVRYFNGMPAFFLDTTTGYLSLGQQEWLRSQLQMHSQAVLVFMHHPPLPGGVPYMDTYYPLHNRAQVQELLFAHPYSVTVFCWHYHVEKTVQQKLVTMHITPATFYQIDAFSADFKVDHQHPGWRVIDIADERITHQVLYLQ